MNYSHNDAQLTIWIDDDEKAELEELKNDDPDHFRTDDAMWGFFESLVANSELSWIDPADTGDLTDAPILGIVDYDDPQNKQTGPFGAVWIGAGQFAPVTNRWGYMEYAVTSPLEMLLATGKCHFVSSN